MLNKIVWREPRFYILRDTSGKGEPEGPGGGGTIFSWKIPGGGGRLPGGWGREGVSGEFGRGGAKFFFQGRKRFRPPWPRGAGNPFSDFFLFGEFSRERPFRPL